ncbi:MAG TPA: type II secretion system protein N [Gammaproteobacteria bacterium]|nr:type II secretion system protein N [Gammaproteobacteria bacterium]
MIDELLSPLLTTAWGRRAAPGFLAVMTVFALITFIQMLWTWRGDFLLTRSYSSENSNNAAANAQLITLIDAIPAWHLLGKYGVVKQSNLLPVTSLKIRLIGVIKSTPDKFSRVIISESNQPGKIFAVGDTLPSSGVRIYAITADGVILNNGGRLEKLPLQRTPLLFRGMPKPLLGD